MTTNDSEHEVDWTRGSAGFCMIHHHDWCMRKIREIQHGDDVWANDTEFISIPIAPYPASWTLKANERYKKGVIPFVTVEVCITEEDELGYADVIYPEGQGYHRISNIRPAYATRRDIQLDMRTWLTDNWVNYQCENCGMPAHSPRETSGHAHVPTSTGLGLQHTTHPPTTGTNGLPPGFEELAYLASNAMNNNICRSCEIDAQINDSLIPENPYQKGQ